MTIVFFSMVLIDRFCRSISSPSSSSSFSSSSSSSSTSFCSREVPGAYSFTAAKEKSVE